jgi:outer membrane protein assembly factor BamB
MRLMLLLAVGLGGATLSAQNWPMFRGPGASGVADASPTPVSWNVTTGENLIWKTAVPGVAVSSPIVWGDRVFVSTAVSSDPAAGIRTGLYGDVEPAKDMSKHTWKLVALDKRTGKIVWGDITLKDDQTQSASIAWSTNRGGPYIPTPVIYGDHLYVLQINGVLAAYEVRSGQRVYQERVAGGGAFSASPVAADGKIYLASEDGDMYVVRAGAKYELLATNPVGQVIMATPAISNGMLIVRGLKDVMAIGRKQ